MTQTRPRMVWSGKDVPLKTLYSNYKELVDRNQLIEEQIQEVIERQKWLQQWLDACRLAVDDQMKMDNQRLDLLQQCQRTVKCNMTMVLNEMSTRDWV